MTMERRIVTKSEFENCDDRAEAERLAAALRDPAGWPRPPDGFEGRVTRRGGRETGHGAGESGQRRRWLKVAASIAAMVSFAGLAAVVGRVVLDAFEEDAGGLQSPAAETGAQKRVPPSAVREENFISQQGGNMMIARKMAGVVGAAVVSVAVSAAELTSEPTLVFTRPETSSFWNTATNNVMTVPVDFPSGATTATLTVSGVGYSATYANIAKGTDSYTFTLPAAVSPQTENVYDLLLAFNDGTERKAKLGLIDGLSPNAEGTTRCLAPSNGRVWESVKGGRAVLPVPYGAEQISVTVNGETRTEPTGLNGAQGWFALGIKGGDEVSLSMIAGGLSYSASLHGALGVMLIVE